MGNSLLETLPEKIASDVPSLVDDIIAVLFKSNPARFIKAHCVPVAGTEQSLVTFEFDALAFGVAFEAEYHAALRANGAELPRGNDRGIGH